MAQSMGMRQLQVNRRARIKSIDAEGELGRRIREIGRAHV